ncbi:MAG: hypothetical protein RIQ78_762 [Bacteroidota bacterium]|jgi:glycosyltransferase involved in cell wall biosynthesis
MKILHLAVVGGENRGGGVHEVTHHYYKHQLSLGITPALWFPGNDQERFLYRQDPNVKVLPTLGNPNYGILAELFYPQESLDFDLVHQHGIWSPISLLSKKYRKLQRGPVIIQPHGFLEPYRLNLKKYEKKIVYSLIEKEAIRNARLLVACSEAERYNLKQMFPNKEIAVISNGVPRDFVDQPTYKVQDASSDKQTMVFLSRIHPLKGLERLLRAIHKIGASKFKNWTLIVAGFQEVNHQEYLIKLVGELGLNSLVSFVGPTFGQDKIDLLSNASVFVFPSYNESFGIVVTEALGRGVPVLTTKGAPWSELETHNCGWWVENSEEGLMDGLNQVLKTDPKTLSLMGERGRALVLDKYTWEDNVKNTLELYNWLINNGKKPSFVA